MSITALKVSQKSAAVVTGAGSGIGKSFAYEIARRGGAVVCADIDLKAANKTALMLQELGTKAVAYKCDVSSEKAVEKLSNEAEELLERPITLVVNNAGVGAGGNVGEMSLKDWKWVVDVNLWGVIHGCHYFTPKLKELGYGGIINVASAAAFGAAPEMGAYNVSKAGVLSLSETLAAELVGSGVNTTVLCPTFVPTNIIENSRVPEDQKKLGALAMDKLAWTNSDKVARQTLSALDQGKLYVMPQMDAKIAWGIKRLAPSSYTRGVGEIYKLFK
ncbi:MAG: SDR family NAD(P)-dependent oxidoreductase [Pseudomonadales bacterium]|nr:SDR family NAD(P)-dependent oxidoreductase [Pseudomonadales bacterium]